VANLPKAHTLSQTVSIRVSNSLGQTQQNTSASYNVAEPIHLDAAPAPGKNFDAAPASAPIRLQIQSQLF
jgi:hypothetical protein